MSKRRTRASYRSRFEGPSTADEYDRLYDPRSYATILWQIERQQLAMVIEELRRTHDSICYLDFAAGTGRIISFVEEYVDESVGIEISPDMATRARSKLRKSRIICMDITKGSKIEGRYDLITAFRFVLNAESELRHSALKALAARLRDNTSLLVFNNHGNTLSHKLLLLPWHRLRSLWRGKEPGGSYMTSRTARRLAKASDLEIIQIFGCGFVGARLARRIPFDKIALLERRLATVRALAPFGVNQIYVARRAR